MFWWRMITYCSIFISSSMRKPAHQCEVCLLFQSIATIVCHCCPLKYSFLSNVFVSQRKNSCFYRFRLILDLFVSGYLLSGGGSSATFDGSESQLNKSESGWTALNMTCTVDWPLHIIMTPGILERWVVIIKWLVAIISIIKVYV